MGYRGQNDVLVKLQAATDLCNGTMITESNTNSAPSCAVNCARLQQCICFTFIPNSNKCNLYD